MDQAPESGNDSVFAGPIDGLFVAYEREFRRIGLKRNDVDTKGDCVLLFNCLSWIEGPRMSEFRKYIIRFILNRPERRLIKYKDYITSEIVSMNDGEANESDDALHLRARPRKGNKSWVFRVFDFFGSHSESGNDKTDLELEPDFPHPINIIKPELRRTRAPVQQSTIDPREHFLYQRFDRLYKKGTVLGKGCYGSVYLASSRKDGKLTYAVKEIPIKDTKTLMSATSELVELKNSDHPNVVKFIEGYMFGGKVWIIMEYCRRGSLRDLVRISDLNESHIAFLLGEILSGLKYLHSRNVIHSDLKGANILLSTGGEVKIADLGLSAIATLEVANVCGTCYWIAPEAMLAWRLTKKSDIYSLGCICVEMITGFPPYWGFSPTKALYCKAKYGFPRVEDGWSDSLRDFVHQCINPDPDLRPEAHALLQHPFLNKKCEMSVYRELVDRSYCIAEMANEVG